MNWRGLDPIGWPGANAAPKPSPKLMTEDDFTALRAEIARMQERLTALEAQHKPPQFVWPNFNPAPWPFPSPLSPE